jgi:hypothetical protein
MTGTVTASTGELQALLDRESIRDRIARLARAEDRRDADAITAGFWQDSTVDYGIFQGDFAAYLAWVTPGSPAVPVTQHVLGQSVIDLRGDVALVETHATAYHRIDMGAEHRDVLLGGRYLDRFEKRDGDWRIAKRTMLYDWAQDVGVSADWANGVMGAPFSGDHYTGRTTDDHSVTFFGP